ncbi:MAG: DUF72 domain-containing protein [Flavisolibacter sp.]
MTSKNSDGFKIYVGCAKWGRKEWKSKIYPPKTSEDNFLEEYAKHYNSLELNATHYKLYSQNQIIAWKTKPKNKDFKFCAKVYKNISHFGSLDTKQKLTQAFINSISSFGESLGPVFLQLSNRFSPKRKEELLEFLKLWPPDIDIFVEVRHKDWFEPAVSDAFFRELKKLNIGSVITDTAGRRDCCHMQLTIPKTFIRYVGNSLHYTDYTRMDAWVKKIKYWKNRGLQEIYFFMHMHDEALSPELTVYFIEKLNKACNLNLQKPQFIENDGCPSLF